MYKVEVDQETCVGCGACAATCPENFELNDVGKAVALNRQVEEVGCNEDAADSCPVEAITVKKLS